MFITISCLAINAFFKFITPYLFNFSFDRSEEMMTGVLFPLIMLISYEFINLKNPVPFSFAKRDIVTVDDDVEVESSDNSFSIRVIGVGITFTGVLIALLGLFSDRGAFLITSIALILIILGLTIWIKNRKPLVKTVKKSEIC